MAHLAKKKTGDTPVFFVVSRFYPQPKGLKVNLHSPTFQKERARRDASSSPEDRNQKLQSWNPIVAKFPSFVNASK